MTSSRILPFRSCHHILPSCAGFLGLLLVSMFSCACADWAGLSRYAAVAEIAIGKREITVSLRYSEDALPRLSRLGGVPNQPVDYRRLEVEILRLLGPDGTPYRGQSQPAQRAQQVATARSSENASEAGSVQEVIVTYRLPNPPGRLTLVPPHGAAETDLGVVVTHLGVPLSDLSGITKPVRLDLNWEDPWRSRFQDGSFVRRHTEPRSYVYVEPYEVRHELLLRLDDLRPDLTIALADGRFAQEKQRETIKQGIGTFLRDHNPLRIDGVEMLPQVDRVEFVRFSREGVEPIGGPEPVDTKAALIGVVLTYLTDHPARTIKLKWDLFGKDARQRSITVVQGRESFDAYVTKDQPVFDWTQAEAFEPIPADGPQDPEPNLRVTPADEGVPQGQRRLAIAILLFMVGAGLWVRVRYRQYPGVRAGFVWMLAGCLAFFPYVQQAWTSSVTPDPRLDDETASAVLQALLHNAYRAYQLRDEETAYDRLAMSLDGDLLTDSYLQQRRAILQQGRGLGGEGRVNRIEMLEATRDGSRKSPGNYAITARWIAHGTVSHWGHSHERRNAYQARLTISPGEDGRWRIVTLDFLDGHRLGTVL